MNLMPEMQVLKIGEMWLQRVIDTLEEVLDELKKLKEQQPKPNVNQ